jgi:ferredoxin
VEKCVQCGICAKSCPVEALRLAPYPIFDREKCIECYCCHELCPEGAIVLERSWLARVMAAMGG